MIEVTATSLRAQLFKILARVSFSAPALIFHKKETFILLPYEQYRSRLSPHKKVPQKLSPLGKGRIKKDLGAAADHELLKHMGFE